jgi:hypothetical protein
MFCWTVKHPLNRLRCPVYRYYADWVERPDDSNGKWWDKARVIKEGVPSKCKPLSPIWQTRPLTKRAYPDGDGEKGWSVTLALFWVKKAEACSRRCETLPTARFAPFADTAQLVS